MNFMGMRLQPMGMGSKLMGWGEDGKIFVGMGLMSTAVSLFSSHVCQVWNDSCIRLRCRCIYLHKILIAQLTGVQVAVCTLLQCVQAVFVVYEDSS